MTTGSFWDERCFWHSGGNYALTLPVGGLVQTLAAGGLAESPETKRRLKNLMAETLKQRQPTARFDAFVTEQFAEMATFFATPPENS